MRINNIAFVHAFGTVKSAQSCPDAALGEQCEDNADLAYFECVLGCGTNDNLCISECVRQSDEDLSNCPCNENCPDGCPCPDYDGCPALDSVLILNTYAPWEVRGTPPSHYTANVPMITDLAGREWTDFEFHFEDEIHVYHSCMLTFQGRHYLYGSKEGDQRQIAQLDKCALKRIGTLPMEFDLGACATAQNAIYLCFEAESDYQTCRVSATPTGPFEPLGAKSIDDHRSIRIAASSSKLLNFCLFKMITKPKFWRSAAATRTTIGPRCSKR